MTTQAFFSAPTFPKHDTQAARLLAAVLLGEKVNPLLGWTRLGIYRLSDTKFHLKEMGWPMETVRLEVSNKHGELCHVAEYALPQWVIDAAGEHGQRFAKHELELMASQREAKRDELINSYNAEGGCGNWHLYEKLKARYGADTHSPFEYDAACRRAAQEAGV